MTFGSILGNEGHLEKSNVKSPLLLKAVDEQLLLHLLYLVLEDYFVQYVKMCILHQAAIPQQWHF